MYTVSGMSWTLPLERMLLTNAGSSHPSGYDFYGSFQKNPQYSQCGDMNKQIFCSTDVKCDIGLGGLCKDTARAMTA